MRPVLMLSAIARVREGLGTARVFTCVRLLSRVASEMCLQVLQSRVRFAAAFELKLRRIMVKNAFCDVPSLHPPPPIFTRGCRKKN